MSSNDNSRRKEYLEKWELMKKEYLEKSKGINKTYGKDNKESSDLIKQLNKSFKRL